MATKLLHNPAANRYEAYRDETLAGYADYHDAGETREFHHTMTFPEFRGQGVAAQLVEFALADTRAAGRKVIPACWYVEQFLVKHPEFADLAVAAKIS